MTETTAQVLWMGEELDFALHGQQAAAAEQLIGDFLDSAGAPGLDHAIVRPAENLPLLQPKLSALHNQTPFTSVVDLTGGEIYNRLPSLHDTVPAWNGFSMGRVRNATDAQLSTTGYVLSHNSEEMREKCADLDLSHVLVLDDTSFSGSTSVVFEGLLKQAFPDRAEPRFTHGFLIMNTGSLGTNPGAAERLNNGHSQAVGGREMRTPRDDGWHVFDIVKQRNLPQHLAVTHELVSLQQQPDGARRVAEFLSDEATLRTAFPNVLTTDEIMSKQRLGHFLVTGAGPKGGFHVRNPQLLAGAIQQGHLAPPEQWRRSRSDTFNTLIKLGAIANAA